MARVLAIHCVDRPTELQNSGKCIEFGCGSEFILGKPVRFGIKEQDC